MNLKFARYSDFLKTQNALSFDVANQIYELILSVEQEDIELSKLLEELIKRAVDYAGIRSRWLSMSTNEVVRMNTTRTQYHDAFIASVDAVSSYMLKKGYGENWRGLLGEDRKCIGDFACFICYIQSINAR